jgi:hypothetical protein
MDIEIAIRVSGFLFLFILVMLAASIPFGNTFGDFDADDRLQKINANPKKFTVSIVIALIEGVRIIALAIMLFIAFSPYNLILGIVWTTCRIGEGLIHIYSETNYWGLNKLARQYVGTSGAEKNALIDAGRNILQRRSSGWTLATTLSGMGTLAYSILFVTHGVVPPIIGWLGIIAGIFLFLGNGIKLVKGNLKVLPAINGLANIGALFVILFEAIIGGWLLFS